jgi:hypothetical protein
MRQLKVLLVFSLLSLVIAGCGGSKKSTTNVSISVTPTTATVSTNESQQFAANVTNGSSSSVVWEVNGVPLGNATVGTINSAGLYTAPLNVPNPATVTITAIPGADTTKSATATVTVTLGPNLSISPSSLTMAAGAQQAFTVLSNGTAATNVTFSLSCKSSAAGACGSVTAAGLFTAPLTPPPNGNVILTAKQTENGSSFSTSATITVQLSAQSLSGQYAFTLAGDNNGTPYRAAGSINFNGSNSITGGSEDINLQGAVTTVNITGGTYTFSATDNRLTANLQTDHGFQTWHGVLSNRSHGYLEDVSAGVSGGGTLDLQDTTKFTQAAVTGNYTFRVAGFDTSSPAGPFGEVGAFTTDGAGNVSSGLLDANDAGSQTSNQTVTGSFTAPSATTGRGTLTLTSGLGSQTFAYYIVDSSRLKLVETTSTRSSAGDAVLQQNGPYSAANFQGLIALVLSGRAGGNALGLGGLVTLSAGNITGGALDVNNGGNMISGPTITGGTYAVQDATTGRTQATVALSGRTISFVFYPQSNSALNILETEATQVSSGVGVLSTGANSGNSVLQGNYALGLTGINIAAGTIQEDVVGQLVANGGGAFTGTVDVSNGGAGTALQSSPYTVSTASTATLKSGFANLDSISFNMYVVNSNQALFLENDSKGVLTGEIQKQQ